MKKYYLIMFVFIVMSCGKGSLLAPGTDNGTRNGSILSFEELEQRNKNAIAELDQLPERGSWRKLPKNPLLGDKKAVFSWTGSKLLMKKEVSYSQYEWSLWDIHSGQIENLSFSKVEEVSIAAKDLLLIQDYEGWFFYDIANKTRTDILIKNKSEYQKSPEVNLPEFFPIKDYVIVINTPPFAPKMTGHIIHIASGQVYPLPELNKLMTKEWPMLASSDGENFMILSRKKNDAILDSVPVLVTLNIHGEGNFSWSEKRLDNWLSHPSANPLKENHAFEKSFEKINAIDDSRPFRRNNSSYNKKMAVLVGQTGTKIVGPEKNLQSSPPFRMVYGLFDTSGEVTYFTDYFQRKREFALPVITELIERTTDLDARTVVAPSINSSPYMIQFLPDISSSSLHLGEGKQDEHLTGRIVFEIYNAILSYDLNAKTWFRSPRINDIKSSNKVEMVDSSVQMTRRVSPLHYIDKFEPIWTGAEWLFLNIRECSPKDESLNCQFFNDWWAYKP